MSISRPLFASARRAAAVLVAATLFVAPGRAGAGTSSDDIPTTGTWSIHSWTKKDGQADHALELSWRRGSEHWGSRSVRLDGSVPEIARAQLTGKAGAVHFELRRDAGVFVCDGHVGNDTGAGLYELQLSPTYADDLAKRGVGRPSREQQIRLALSDMSFAFLDELEKQGYPKPDLDRLLMLCNHGVDRTYVDGMGALGIRFDSFEELLQARDHGVDPRFVQGMRDAGFTGLTYAELLKARDHGVDPRYVHGMRELGYTGLSMRELLTLRDRGVDSRFIQALADAGYRKLSLEELLRTRDHGVDSRYIKGMVDAGYKDVELADLVRARQHGVDGRVAKRINAGLSSPASLERLIQIHRRGGGVTAALAP